MEVFKIVLLTSLVLCTIACALSRRLLVSIIIFMAYSLVMSIIWITLKSPDLAITEAAIGVGITSVLFFVTLRKINLINREEEEHEEEDK